MTKRPRRHASLFALIAMVTISASLALVAWSASDWGALARSTSPSSGAGELALALGAMIAIFALVRLLFGEGGDAAGKVR